MQPVQTSVCHKFHVFVVEVGRRQTVGVCGADGLVWSIATRSFAQIRCIMLQYTSCRLQTASPENKQRDVTLLACHAVLLWSYN